MSGEMDIVLKTYLALFLAVEKLAIFWFEIDGFKFLCYRIIILYTFL